MRIISVDHMTINVTDMEKSIEFYENLLGLERKEYVDMGDHVIQYLETQENDRLELISYCYKTKEISSEADNRGIYRHIAYQVENLDEIWKKLQRAGAKVLTQPSFCEKLQFRNFLVRDPNGVEIELVERRAAPSSD